ncbi:DUF4375 domain-containing protein [Sphingomonas sp. NFR15]|uniref:DMP19 family protein n=1 Tax=Sphingomonas sp. NFR15 TaxID=1566282 RepID=UPI00089208A4|nr:DUF4375 domain-containing protein [Sphingomonas sp. NFR15]SDA36629.1 protein of unknown function [Sphingomonas sp. NFR15]
MKQRLIERIPVPQSEVRTDEPGAACLWVGYFIEEAVERGYEEDELPPEVLRFLDVWEYHGERGNGGHAQYYENEENCRPKLKLMAKFLKTIGLPEHGRLIEDFEHFSIRNEGKIDDLYEREENGAVREMFYGFDDRFMQLEQSEGKLVDRLAGWLLQQPWIEIEETGQSGDVTRLRQLIADPPDREARLAAKMRRREAENRGALLAFARRFLAYRTRGPKPDR